MLLDGAGAPRGRRGACRGLGGWGPGGRGQRARSERFQPAHRHCAAPLGGMVRILCPIAAKDHRSSQGQAMLPRRPWLPRRGQPRGGPPSAHSPKVQASARLSFELQLSCSPVCPCAPCPPCIHPSVPRRCCPLPPVPVRSPRPLSPAPPRPCLASTTLPRPSNPSSVALCPTPLLPHPTPPTHPPPHSVPHRCCSLPYPHTPPTTPQAVPWHPHPCPGPTRTCSGYWGPWWHARSDDGGSSSNPCGSVRTGM